MSNQPCDPPDCCPPGDLAPAVDHHQDQELARLAKALGHPARIAILRLLDAQESCICGDIAHHLPLAQSTVSQHLKHLKEAGLIRGTIAGPRVCYCIDRPRMKHLKMLIASL